MRHQDKSGALTKTIIMSEKQLTASILRDVKELKVTLKTHCTVILRIRKNLTQF